MERVVPLAKLVQSRARVVSQYPDVGLECREFPRVIEGARGRKALEHALDFLSMVLECIAVHLQ
eukprot:21603-Eustigmatos_ZCMA.PRE.1